MTRKIPRILVAGTHSGTGKTTLTLGLVAALRRRGLKVQPFKVGPDYLDPTWLAAASGRPCYNLDGWMSGRDYVEASFRRVSADADIAVIEGVMGLFDGPQSSGLVGSSAEIARWLQAPVLLVVTARGMGGSIAPLVAGFAGFQEGVNIRGVIANGCGTERHRNILHEALRASAQPELLGAVPPKGFPELAGRHLGLVPADPERNCPPAIFDTFGRAVERYVDLDAVLQIAGEAPPLQPRFPAAAEKSLPVNPPIRLAVARDDAFFFYYEDLFDALEERGCRCVFFSPLRDAALPADIDAVYIGGGYPEAFPDTLSTNDGMAESLRRFAQSGGPVYAECGGLIYLSQALTTREGHRYPLLGILPAETRMCEIRKRLGYVAVTLTADTLWGKAGERLRGHEFHYSELLSVPTNRDDWTGVYGLESPRGDRDSTEGFYHRRDRILASYVHLHLASRPDALAHFLSVCETARSERLHQTSREEITP